MSAVELFANLNRLGIQLMADGERLRYAPRSALTPDLIDRMKAHKAELLALLRPAVDRSSALPAATVGFPVSLVKPTKPVCRCGSTARRDVPIHHGQSIRRDCGRCGRFIEFPVWYGADTLRTAMDRMSAWPRKDPIH
jgi:hypothetical protein